MKLLTAGGVLVLAALTGCSSTQHQVRGTARGPEAENSTFAVARLYEKQRSFDRAATAYQELAIQQPNDHQPVHRLGVIAVKQGQLAEGLSHLENAARLAADDVDVLADLGYAQFLNGDVEQAVDTYQSALAVEPTNQRTSVNLAIALAYLGKDDQALNTFRSVSSSAEAYTGLGYIYSQKGDKAKAEEYFHKAIDEDSSHAPASEGLLQLARTDHNKSSGRSGQLPEGISVVAVRPVTEELSTAKDAGHSLSDLASGAVKPASTFETALAHSKSRSADGSASTGNVPSRAIRSQTIQTVSHEESSARGHEVRTADASTRTEAGQSTRDSLMTVLQYGGPEAQITAIYDLLHLNLVDQRAATALNNLSRSQNQQVAEAARDAIQIAQAGVVQ